MPARLTAYPAEGAALVRLLEDGARYVVGRGADCGVRLAHASVSRRHAALWRDAGGWRIEDLGSKNGLSLEGRPGRGGALGARAWLMIGDVHCAFETLDEAAAAAHRTHEAARRSTARALSARLQPRLGAEAVLPQALDTALALSGLERGFVLYGAAGEPLRVRAARGLDAGELAAGGFAGSGAVVERVLREGAGVICTDVADAPWLAARPSVRLGGIRALLCLPFEAAAPTAGVLYADSRRPGAPLTELDVELVEGVTRQAAAALAAAHLEDRVAALLRDAAKLGVDAPAWPGPRAG